jgi:hypothetical protein
MEIPNEGTEVVRSFVSSFFPPNIRIFHRHQIREWLIQVFDERVVIVRHDPVALAHFVMLHILGREGLLRVLGIEHWNIA